MPTLKFTCPIDSCGDENEVEAEIEPGEMYGQDADGNRGVWVPASVIPPDAPDKCSKCDATFTLEQHEAVQKQLDNAAGDYTFEPDEPDEDEDDDDL